MTSLTPHTRLRRLPRWALLFLEVLMNLGAGPVMILAPELVLKTFVPDDAAIDPVAAEAQRWFGAMCFVFGGVYLGAMLFGEYPCHDMSSCCSCGPCPCSYLSSFSSTTITITTTTNAANATNTTNVSSL